ncbi:glycosyltransferase [Bythopirellula polymerisocia]|uniref:Glycosyltransferase subfamily 4-like N-terminal domain-containing protein n=1 Tax=Bythopirellula polymerisocia TaxID=2528003 RepID=A0A5C6CM89_9BACT|nr:glycosyltransferase [Bythopirellula polymerisocia]TWU24677.1 hypothetical protein Pla144_35630 [Bythopirellula polymerisocia]
MKKKLFPKVAIVSCNPMRADISNGLLMRSLFSSWPKDRLTQIYFPVGASYPPEFDVCVDYRRISSFGTVERLQENLATIEEKKSSLHEQEVSKSRTRHKLLVALKQQKQLFQWSKCLQEIWYGHSWIGRTLRQQLKDCKPDIVYALIGNYSLAKNTLLACRHLRIPLFMHVTDDYVSSLYRSMPFGKTIAAASESWFSQCIDYSCGRAGISPSMAEEYEAKYLKPWDTFTTGTSPDSYDPSPRPSDGIVRFIYAGNLGLERWRQLRALAAALNELAAQSSRQLSLDIYSSAEQINAYRKDLEVSPIVKLRGWCPSEELPRVFQDADVLVHVESFDEDVTALTRLSLSTKLYQYMMAGRCLLGFGPEHLASMKLIQQTTAGVVVSTNQVTSIAEAIRENCLEDKIRLKCGLHGRAWAKRWGDIHQERERFRQALVNALKIDRSLEIKQSTLRMTPFNKDHSIAWRSRAS